jgi:hypothetical protein
VFTLMMKNMYLKGALDFGICYTRDHDFRLSGYTDSD